VNDGEAPKAGTEEMAYDDQKRLAHDGSFEERRDLAQRGDVRPEILYFLASDPDTEVRRHIARNHKAPRHADLLLAKDEQDEVRTDVAGKISEISLSIAGGKQDNVYKLTMEALEVLARDQLVRVR
jgi:thymidylate kinase